MYLFGFWEPNLTALLTARLARGVIFVDVGANIGYFTMLASRVVIPAGRTAPWPSHGVSN
ncbi:hypothetical protein ACIOC2_36280 [Streptomyces sp. NPDC088337]|uniref:hypothetical protein n=1 Tax=unclassified Streptomyces TaxID=2593676 RepID=UPI002DD8E57A|nr:hypothetical protein [Streptomyces sp. NBC_01788]